jgi:hypothetical protein
MPTTLTTLIAATRSILNETTTRFFSDAEITTWLNDGCRDIARRAEVIQQFNTSVAAVAAQAKYALPTDIIRVHRVEYVPTGQTQTYTLMASTEQELDQVFGINQDQQGVYPQYYAIWGYPGGTGAAALKMRVYPVPAIAGTFNIFYYAVPAAMVNGSDVAIIPEGWQDLLVLYAEYAARRKDQRPDWSDAKQLYDEKIEELIEVTRKWHDQAGSVSVGGNNVPSWLYSFDW